MIRAKLVSRNFSSEQDFIRECLDNLFSNGLISSQVRRSLKPKVMESNYFEVLRFLKKRFKVGIEITDFKRFTLYCYLEHCIN